MRSAGSTIIPWDEDQYRRETRWFSSPWMHQIYRSLCLQYWLDGSLPNREIELRAACDMVAGEWDEVWSRHWPTIGTRFFTVKSERLRHAGIDGRWRKLRKKSRQKAEAGRKGAQIRWERHRAHLRAVSEKFQAEVAAKKAVEGIAAEGAKAAEKRQIMH